MPFFGTFPCPKKKIERNCSTMKIESSKKYERLHESEDLFRSYIAAVGKGKRKLPPPIEAFTAIVSKKIVSVSSRVSGIVTKLRKGAKRHFGEFFSDASSRSEMVATFLAMLELIKANKIKAWGSGDKVIVEQCEEVEDDISYIISEFSSDGNGEITTNEQ